MKARKGKGLFVFCCLAPAAILFIVFMILPTIDIFRMSMFKWGGYTAVSYTHLTLPTNSRV